MKKSQTQLAQNIVFGRNSNAPKNFYRSRVRDINFREKSKRRNNTCMFYLCTDHHSLDNRIENKWCPAKLSTRGNRNYYSDPRRRRTRLAGRVRYLYNNAPPSSIFPIVSSRFTRSGGGGGQCAARYFIKALLCAATWRCIIPIVRDLFAAAGWHGRDTPPTHVPIQ